MGQIFNYFKNNGVWVSRWPLPHMGSWHNLVYQTQIFYPYNFDTILNFHRETSNQPSSDSLPFKYIIQLTTGICLVCYNPPLPCPSISPLCVHYLTRHFKQWPVFCTGLAAKRGYPLISEIQSLQPVFHNLPTQQPNLPEADTPGIKCVSTWQPEWHYLWRDNLQPISVLATHLPVYPYICHIPDDSTPGV